MKIKLTAYCDLTLYSKQHKEETIREAVKELNEMVKKTGICCEAFAIEITSLKLKGTTTHEQ